MIRDHIDRFLRNSSRSEPPGPDSGPRVDPTLVDILADGVDAAFHDGRDEAVEKLNTLDVAAFWLQAVGDGSPLEPATDDMLEASTPHRMAWQAGFDDTLDHHEIGRIAHQLFAHHIGTMVTPAHESISDRAALDNLLQPSVKYANDLYSEPTENEPDMDDWEEMQYPRPTPLGDALEDGCSLLETERLSYFWIQVLCDVGSSTVMMQFGGSPSDTPTMVVDHPIEYVVGIPRSLDSTTEINLNIQSLAQHLSYGARATDASIEEFSSHALEMALELEYLHDSPSPV